MFREDPANKLKHNSVAFSTASRPSSIPQTMVAGWWVTFLLHSQMQTASLGIHCSEYKFDLIRAPLKKSLCVNDHSYDLREAWVTIAFSASLIQKVL